MRAGSPRLHLVLQLLAFQTAAGQLAPGLVQLLLQPTHAMLLLLKLTCVVGRSVHGQHLSTWGQLIRWPPSCALPKSTGMTLHWLVCAICSTRHQYAEQAHQ